MRLVAGVVFFVWPTNLYLFGQEDVLRWIRTLLDSFSGNH